jgi:hypothetical protein
MDAIFAAGPQYTGGEEEYEEWYEEEGGYEYASYHHEAKPASGEAESAVLEENGASFGPGIEMRGSASDSVPLCEPQSGSLPCARYAFSLGEAWDWAKGQGKRLWHKAVRLVHWAIDKQVEASHPGISAVPYRSEVADACEVVGAATLFSPLPGPSFLKFVASAAIYNNC